ncbi:hypothetical protein SDC9_20641 [bioreactor metagenome]|uniref:Uncharacterized protein n=1 Tax=bioreactor metagenome TaxID=1076179 RepID=A0A644U7M4_9ZZZZ
MKSHAEQAEARRFDRGAEARLQAEREHLTGLARIDHAVVPQPRRGIERVALALEHLDRRALERGLFLGRPAAALALDPLAAHGGKHPCRLLAAHHRNPRIGPAPQEARRIGAPGHAVIAGAETAADQHGDLRHRGGGDGGHHLRAVARDALVLVFAADHEAGDILQEDQRDRASRAKLDEMRGLLRGLGKEHAVVRDDAHRAALEMGETGHDRLAEARLELVEAAPVDHPRDHLADVVGGAQIGGHRAEDLLGVIGRGLGRLPLHRRGLRPVQVAHRPAGERQRMGVVLGKVIGDARKPGVHVAAAEVLGRDHLACCRLHQRRTGEEDRPLFLHDDRHVGHRRHIGAARGAAAHHHRDLRDALRRHPRLIVEDPSEMVAVGEDLVLVGQVRAARVDQIDAGQIAFLGDLLRTQVFLHRHRVIGAALHRGVVRHHHHLEPHHPANTGDDTRARRGAVIHAMRRRRTDLEEGRARIEQPRHPLARRHLAARDMACRRLGPAPGGRGFGRRAHSFEHFEMGRAVGAEALGGGQDGGGQLHSCAFLSRNCAARAAVISIMQFAPTIRLAEASPQRATSSPHSASR